MNSAPRRLVDVSASTLPSGEANAVREAQMCGAFAELGVALRGKPGFGGGASAKRPPCAAWSSPASSDR